MQIIKYKVPVCTHYTYDRHINIAVSQGLGTPESGVLVCFFPKFFWWVPKLEEIFEKNIVTWIVHEQLAAIDPPACLLQGVFLMLILLMLFIYVYHTCGAK